jgi:hypothetical protein
MMSDSSSFIEGVERVKQRDAASVGNHSDKIPRGARCNTAVIHGLRASKVVRSTDGFAGHERT